MVDHVMDEAVAGNQNDLRTDSRIVRNSVVIRVTRSAGVD
jgi:hypothetical protein